MEPSIEFNFYDLRVSPLRFALKLNPAIPFAPSPGLQYIPTAFILLKADPLMGSHYICPIFLLLKGKLSGLSCQTSAKGHWEMVWDL